MLLKNFLKIDTNFYLYLVGLFPLALLTGTLISEIFILAIILGFIYEMFINKDFAPLKNKVFVFLLIIWAYLLFNHFIISVDRELSFSRSLSFIRFPLLIFAISFFINKSNKKFEIIFKLWGVILAITIFDLFFQYFFGFNTLGFDIAWAHGKLSGFLGHELKMAHLLIGFVMPTIAYYHMKNNKLFLTAIFLSIFLVILYLINERSNAIKGTFIIFFVLFFLNNFDFKKKILGFIVFLSIIGSLITFNHEINQRFYNEIKSMSNNLKSEKTWHNNIKTSILELSPLDYIKYSNYGPHYYAAADIFKNNKWFGIGLKTFRTQCEFAKVPEDIISKTASKFLCSVHLTKPIG